MLDFATIDPCLAGFHLCPAGCFETRASLFINRDPQPLEGGP